MSSGADVTSARAEGEMDAVLLGRTRALKVWPGCSHVSCVPALMSTCML